MIDIGARVLEFQRKEHTPVQEIPFIGQFTEPDPAWTFTRKDGKEVKWVYENGYWHIPHLLKQVESADAVLVDDSVIEPDEDAYWSSRWTEEYVDPTSGEVVTPGRRSVTTPAKVAGRTVQAITLRVFLRAAEVKMMTPQGSRPLAKDYKHEVKFQFQGANWIARGSWVTADKPYHHDHNFRECELSVDKIEPVTNGG